ncbi:membrane protein [Helicobacter pylori]|uniref:membrane protein n=1 Tax=Helicobacter pylori TaxID=210 RepID=UPI00026B3143|nr:membrane protein [Helicobacter pylori]EJC14079.1 putative membrane protein [Helicobacter pylori Hp P-25]EJC35158.1 putative membrane protein [Helicobacter pylori Hp P-25c]EJC35993.1 putative membrane protein [Helicobacter pylori Hp P-25d]WQU07556.1 PAP2 family protein [Helicobacter pylori]WQU11988.1 PAP2 family protein [Helicobacter pylori]
MAENSFKNVSIQPKPFFLLPVKTLFLLGGVFSAFFILIAGLVFFDYANSMDNAIFNLMRSNSSNPILDQTLQRIVFLGSSQFVLPLSLLVGVFLSLYRKNLALGVWFVLSVVIFEALLESLKHLLAHSIQWLSHSANFPSAIALSLALFYGLLILLIPHFIAHQIFQNILSYSLFGLILLIGLALIVLGVSFSSVLGGVCLGALGACFSIGIYLSVFQKI